MRQFVLPGTVADGSFLELTGKNHRYLSRVLRLRPGDEFPAVDAGGSSFTCRISDIQPESTSLHIAAAAPATAAGRTEDVTLVMGLPKGKKIDLVIRQSTECGVKCIIPLLSSHSDIRLDSEDYSRKLERWNRVAREALQQSGMARAPEILVPLKPPDLQKALSAYDNVLVCHETRRSEKSLHSLLGSESPRIAVIVGPEGGFSREELELFDSFHYDSVYLGGSVLRAETAAIYAIAAVQTIVRESTAWKSKSPEQGT